MFKHLFILLVGLLLFSSQAYAQFKCTSGSGRCSDKNDYVCNLSQSLWGKIKSLEDVWAVSLIPSFDDKHTIRYSGYKKYCRHQGYSGDKMAQIFVQVQEDTPELKKYRVIHSACGKDNILVETWEVQGKELLPLNLKSIIFDLNRKFELASGETYKSFTLENDGAEFKAAKNSRTQHIPFKADNIFRFTIQKYSSLTKDKIQTDKLHSYFWLFNKKVFSQVVDKTLEKTTFNFYSPMYQFAPRFNRFNFNKNKCYKSEVNITFDQYQLIKSTGDTREYGFDYSEFITNCINQEATNYVESAGNILESHLKRKFPIFSNSGAINRNAKLQKEVETILRYIEGGNRDLSIVFTKKLLEDVKSRRVIDNR